MTWYRRLRNVFRLDRVSRDLDREIAFHLAERADDLAAAGVEPPAAAAEARRRFGHRGTIRDAARDVDVLLWLESLGTDLRHAARALAKSPAFTAVALASLALGIGANTAIFSLVNALVLKSLPVVHPEELVQITMRDGGSSFTNPLWEQIRDRLTVFSGALAYSDQRFNLAAAGEARRVPGAWVSGDFFRVLGIAPAAGRTLVTADDFRGCPGVAVVSAGFADRELGGALAATGQTISLDGHPFDVVGVTPPGFFGISVGRAVDVYAPLCAQGLLSARGPAILDARSRWYLNLIARTRPGVTLNQARAALIAAAPAIYASTVPPNWAARDQHDYQTGSLNAQAVTTGLSELRDMYTFPLQILMVVVLLVLLIACANIANLLLARATTRQREIAIRMSLGAGRGRVVRQLLTESLLLALLGAAAGVVFAHWATVLLLRHLSFQGDHAWLDVALDARVLVFTVGVATVTGVLFGLVPAWRATRADPQSALKAGGRGVVDPGHRGMGRALVVAQVALSLTLVTAAGLWLGSFRNLVTLDPGFRTEGVLLVSTDLAAGGAAADRQAARRIDLLARVRALPGVRQAGVAFTTPIGGTGWNNVVIVPGYTATSLNDSLAYFNQVSGGTLAALGTRILTGRDLGPADGPHSPHVALVNLAMARKFFGSDSPLGRTFRVPLGPNVGDPITIVGVVEDAKYARLTEKNQPTAYVPFGQGDGGSGVTFIMRGAGSPGALIPEVKQLFAQADPGLMLDITTFTAQVSASLARPRLLATLAGFFGTLALLLAIIGLYGTVSYDVNRRRGEIGIRMALGAGAPGVVRLVLGDAGRLVALGVLVGITLVIVSTRFVASLLYGLAPRDPLTLTVATVTLVVVAMVAALAPALRASRLAPMDALRED